MHLASSYHSFGAALYLQRLWIRPFKNKTAPAGLSCWISGYQVVPDYYGWAGSGFYCRMPDIRLIIRLALQDIAGYSA